MTELTNAEQFFYNNAGYSWHPLRESQEEGHIARAKELAQAEVESAANGYSCQWEEEVPEDEERQWECTLYTPDGLIVNSLSGVVFTSGQPWGSDYRRVVEAELYFEVVEEVSDAIP